MSQNSQSSAAGKKVLVLGGTGAMGVYLVPELAAMGYEVKVVSLDDVVSDNPSITYVKGNGKDEAYITELLKEKFDAIVDFMIYNTEEFKNRYELLLENTGQYIYLSSYRIYSGGVPITEDTPRLLDVSEDKEFLKTDDYSLYKARGEDVLRASKYDNWTIVRPAITYSQRRFQLVTLEANVVVARALKGLPVVVPKDALSVQATMSWGGDVARLMAHLLFNKDAIGESFTLATAEHHTWGEIAEYYKEIIGLDYVAADTDDYLKIVSDSTERVRNGAWYQLAYDRLFDREVDNSKVLRVTGLKQEDFMTLREGLEKELSALPKDVDMSGRPEVWERMDEYLRRVKG